MNLYQHKDSNIRKTWLLLTMFLVMIIAVGYAISYVYNAPEILYFAVLLSLVMNIVAYWQSDKIALAASGAKIVPRQGNEYIYRMVENLAITAGLPMPRIAVIPSEQINAFATGRNPENAVVAVTTGSMSKLENEELEGVLAHELAHIGNRDILLSTVLVVLAGVISIASDIFFRSSFRFSNDNNGKAGGIIAVVALVAAILAPIAASLIQLAVSRKREFLADATGALITRYPEGLARALEKIEHDHAPLRHAHASTAHMYISNPFRLDATGKRKGQANWFVKLFMTHPPINERVAALRGMHPDQAK